jgi:hypothetical protein
MAARRLAVRQARRVLARTVVTAHRVIAPKAAKAAVVGPEITPLPAATAARAACVAAAVVELAAALQRAALAEMEATGAYS